MTVSRKKEPSCYTYLINNQPLAKVIEHKYLGITLTCDLKWDTHITSITTTALRKLFYLKRCLKLSPPSTKLLAYTTFVRPILEYANTVWFPHSKTNIKKLETVQRKAVRFIHNKYKRTDSPTNLLVASGLQTLEARAIQSRLIFLFQILHNTYKIDHSKYVAYSQSRESRHKHLHTLVEYSHKVDAFKHSFFPSTIRKWNQLDRNITSTNTLSEFRTKIEALTLN